MKLRLIQFGMIAGVLVFASCVSFRSGYLEDDQKAAERAVDQFHSRFSNERYDEIYADTAEEFRKTADKSDLIAAMKQTHEQFGPFNSSGLTSANIIMGVPRQVRLTYATSYEKGDATEEFLWLVNFDDVKLASYKVSARH
jgi:hypothetical protein